MKANNRNQLQLVSGNALRKKNTRTKEPDGQIESLEKAALSLIAAKTTGRISPSTIDALVLALQEAKCPNTIVQLSLEVTVLLINTQGDASICFKFDVANFGRQTLVSRTHRFWFTSPQEDINISVSTESGYPLEIERVETTPNFVEVRVHFPKPLEPADQLAYRFQYQVKKNFFEPAYYDITARTLTKKMSVTILSPENYHFNSAGVSLESADGYISDCPPLVSISNESGRDKLTWSHRSARLGEQFRTRWSLA